MLLLSFHFYYFLTWQLKHLGRDEGSAILGRNVKKAQSTYALHSGPYFVLLNSNLPVETTGNQASGGFGRKCPRFSWYLLAVWVFILLYSVFPVSCCFCECLFIWKCWRRFCRSSLGYVLSFHSISCILKQKRLKFPVNVTLWKTQRLVSRLRCSWPPSAQPPPADPIFSGPAVFQQPHHWMISKKTKMKEMCWGGLEDRPVAPEPVRGWLTQTNNCSLHSPYNSISLSLETVFTFVYSFFNLHSKALSRPNIIIVSMEPW